MSNKTDLYQCKKCFNHTWIFSEWASKSNPFFSKTCSYCNEIELEKVEKNMEIESDNPSKKEMGSQKEKIYLCYLTTGNSLKFINEAIDIGFYKTKKEAKEAIRFFCVNSIMKMQIEKYKRTCNITTVKKNVNEQVKKMNLKDLMDLIPYTQFYLDPI